MTAYRPLNVKDALSYLDQVKVQFQHRPDVYNHFLDIMKDFKSQSIDTPGVIDRVATLFRGHPSLIQGFNTFLPPGYRVECSLDPSDPTIRVTTPMGTTTRLESNGNGSYDQWNGQGQPPQGQQQQQQQPAPPGAQVDQGYMPYGAPDQQSSMSHLQAAANRGNVGAERKSGGPVEFNHAINYVNKIKTRFSHQPDIYKHFLEILQTYQREQKPIAEVYQQVTVLFQNAPDLLEDFKQFLPDTSGGAPGDVLTGQHQPAEYYQTQPPTQLPPVGNFSPPVGGPKMKKLEVTHEQVNHYDASKNREIPTSHVRGAVSGSKRKVHEDVSPTLVPGVPEPIQPPNKTSNLIEEIGFFDKVKKAIGSKQSYNEFLKILNLFNQDLIDKKVLVERIEGFIGSHHDLFDWFKTFVGFDNEPLHIENITFKKHQLDLTLCKPYGPSYRKLPKVETYMPCSGRDEMCWEVLNDEWVGHPTWASEDSGFIAHRKNQYEEILHKIEEERHEYDFYMESNLRTIQTLETIANRIANMTAEEKETFKLPSGLGHTSQTIYRKVIRKIYGKEKGFEVIDALHDHPIAAVPIVLKRLKQKDEEWRRAHREWNKVWRELEQKVFFKSLDHLGLTFKQADKKLLTTKQLVSEISTIKVEQTTKRLHPLTPKPQAQLNYEFLDNDILYDIGKFVNVFLATSSYSSNDKERLFEFFKSFLILCFSLDPEEVEQSINKRLSAQAEKPVVASSTSGDAVSNSSSSSDASPPVNGRKRHLETDLLKDVLRKSKKSHKDDTPESSTSPSQEPAIPEDTEDETVAEDINTGDSWVQSTDADTSSTENDKRTVFNMFSNTNIYVFFRHLRVLYDRLNEVKGLNNEVTADLVSRSDVGFAKDLNLISNQLEEMGLQFTKSDAYTQLLSLSERLIDGEVEHQWFEESIRQAYRNRAYKLNSVDKVVQALVKHLHTIMTDHRSSEILMLFEKDRKAPTTNAKDQIIYRNAVRSQMNPDDNMFRIQFDVQNHKVSIEYVALDDLTLKDQNTDEQKWNYYLTSYCIAQPTEGVNVSEIRLPFIKSHALEDGEEGDLEGYTDSQLKIKVARDTYKLFFEPKSHDEFTRYSTYNTLTTKNTKKDNKFGKVLQRKAKEVYQDDDAILNMGASLKILKEDPKKFLEAMEQKARDSEKQIDEDQTIEKADETIPEVTVTKKTNPAISSVLDQDVTVDADSTIPQDDSMRANDSTADEAAIADESNNATAITEHAKATTDTLPSTETDKDGGDHKVE